MVKLKTSQWDMVRYLVTDEDRADYLEAGLEEGDTPTILAILGDIAKSRGCVEEALKAGLPKEFLTVGELPDAMPAFGTILTILKVVGLELHVKPASMPQGSRS